MGINQRLLKNIFVASLILWTIQTFATTYEDAEDNTTTGWVNHGDTNNSTIINVYDSDRGSQVIKLTGNKKMTEYRIGNLNGRGRKNNWNDKTKKVLQWSMKYNEKFIVLISLLTEKGNRFLAYTNQNKDTKGKIRGGKVRYGLGENSIDGTWHTFKRDLEADWNAFVPNNPIVAVNGFFIRGSGYIDDIITHDDNVTTNDISLENLMHVTTDKNISKKIKILGIGSGGSHYLLFHHSDGKTVIESGDMGAMSISHNGGKTFQQLTSYIHAKDINNSDNSTKYTLPRLNSIIEHPKNPDWLFGVATYGIISFSTDRGETWYSKDAGPDITNKIVIRNEGDKIIAYFASGYKLGRTQMNFYKLGAWVDITDIPHNISSFHKNKEYGFILYNKDNPTGYNKHYYGDIVRLGTADDNKLFVAGKSGLFVCEGDPKKDDNWRNITDSIFKHKDGVFPLDHAVTIGDKLYVLARGDSDNINDTAGVYVHTRGDITNGKYNFTRIYKGLNLKWFNYSKKVLFKRNSGALLEHKDTSDGKSYLYVILESVVYRLDIEEKSTEFERVTKSVDVDGKTYSKGFILGQRNTEHWSRKDNGSYTSFNESEEFGTMTFGNSYFPSFTGLNKVYSHGGKIYASNTIEIKISKDNGKTFNSYTSKISNSEAKYDGKIKGYYGYIGIYEDGTRNNKYKTKVTPTDDAVSFWWSGVKNIGMDNMVSTDIAINPNNPKEMMQTYMDSAAFFSDDEGNSWHYTAGLRGILSDAYWTQWIKDSFYAQDASGIYKFNKTKLEFEKLDNINISMSIDESVRIRRYYDKDSDTLVLAGYESSTENTILVMKHFTDDSLREFKKIKDSRNSKNNGIEFNRWKGKSRSFKDVFCDGQYVYAINAEFGVIKMPLNNLPTNYNNSSIGLDENEYVFSGLFNKNRSAILVTAIIDKLDDSDTTKVEKDYTLKYSKLLYSKQSFKLKKIDIVTKENKTIIPRGEGLTIDGKSRVAQNKMLTLLGIDPKNKNRILASIANTQTTIESKDSGKTWSEFIPQISGNSHGHQSGNAVFAPSGSLYDVIIFGTGSTYGVLK